MSEPATIEADSQSPERLRLGGDWHLDDIVAIARQVAQVRGPANSVDASAISLLDSAGVLMLLRLLDRLGLDAECIVLKDEHRALVEAVLTTQQQDRAADAPVFAPWLRFLEGIGSGMVSLVSNLGQLLSFMGLTLITLLAAIPRPSRWRITSTVHHMQQTGLDALPLVALLSFLVGAVIAFLGATVLRDFGAELFVIDLTTYAFLREFGVLLTAILLAGRTSSAFTAQIGTMKSREEIDAIRTLGMDPIVLLVLPRLLALIIMLPVLAVIAMLAGLLGGLMVAVFSLGIPFDLFLSRVYETVELRHYLVGLSKAPLFALVIALVGCLEGFKVTGTAQSVGERTTSSVVQSISLVIVIDALAAVFFMEIGW
jgi:phospholipid/cholesterol/gamma-HCH transport system permease protein